MKKRKRGTRRVHERIVIVYRSKTGFTQRYAEQLAEALGCAALTERAARRGRLRGCETLVFGTRAHAGRVDGLKDALRLRAQSGARLVLFVTGAMPGNAAALDAFWRQNLSEEQRRTIPHFYLQSGLCYERMGPVDRFLMHSFAAMLRKKPDKTPEDEATERVIAHSFDCSDPAYLQPLLTLLRSAPEEQ